MNSSKLVTFIFIFLVAVSCTPRSLSVAQKNACMAPSANFKALDAIHSTKIHAILWAKKFAKQAYSKELSLSDKCRQTQILIKALYGLRDGESATWENPQNNTSGKIKILNTIVQTGIWGYGGCRDYLSYIKIDDKLEAFKFRACPKELGAFELVDSAGFPIPGHLYFAGWYFYDYRFFE